MLPPDASTSKLSGRSTGMPAFWALYGGGGRPNEAWPTGPGRTQRLPP